LRLFKNGQYAYFASNKNDIDINKLDRASYVGYYIVEDNILKLETPTGNINTKSYRIIWDFEIENNGTLKNKKSNLEYEIIKDISLMKIEPDW
jgi:putative methionine-R-sulfoxide reductase with GAF domain